MMLPITDVTISDDADDAMRARLRALGLSQTAAAEALGVTQSAVHKWAVGARPVPAWAWRALDNIERVRKLEAMLAKLVAA